MGGQNVIVKLGDRKHSGFCIQCGTILMMPYNDYQCCSECTKNIQKALYEFEKKKRKFTDKKKKMPKTSGRIVITSDRILRQVAPIGEPVK